ncbi:MAG: MmgE/PrpD family protein [Betaproteobacteria bacterium]|nr:MmgE/PrpD family protein [Betaproteobacteria bacterium]
MKDAIFELARRVVRTRFEDLPEEVITTAKMFILDTFGVGLAGSTAAGCGDVVQLIKEQGGRSDSSILVYGGKVPAQEAAFANSMMIHALDFDDSHEGQVGAHCNVTVLPAALALAPVEYDVALRAVAHRSEPQFRAQAWHRSDRTDPASPQRCIVTGRRRRAR